MSSKHVRLNLSVTDTHKVSAHTNHTSAGMMPGNAAVMEMRPVAMPVQTTTLTLNTIPLEVFALIAYRLCTADVLSLSRAASYFQRALFSIELYGSSLLQRSQDLCRHHHSYDENTQTLDLRQIKYKSLYAGRESFEIYLRTIEVFLLSHRIWARTHIKTLIIPLERIIMWKLADRLTKIIIYLPGITHLHLSLQPISQRPLGRSDRGRLLENLAALKTIPAHKVTIENSTLIENLTETLHQAFTNEFFYYGIRCLSISHRASSKFYTYRIAISPVDHSVYSRLNTLDYSLARSARLEIQQLPGTITCLRTSGTTHIEGYAPSIKRLEVLGAQTNGISAIEYFFRSQKALPGLKTLYIEPPADSLYHQRILKALIQQRPSDLSITFATLHLQQIDLLEKLLSVFHGDIQLPKEITFQLNSPADMHCFVRLAGQGVFGHLTGIRFQVESLLIPLSSFYTALATLLQQEKLLHLENFMFVYQYNEAVRDKPAMPFSESVEGRLYLLQSRTLFTLQDIFKPPYHDYFVRHFIVFDTDKTKLFQAAYPDSIQRQKFLLDLRQRLVKVTGSSQHLMQQASPAAVWLFRLEQLYLELYSTYILHLWQSDIPQPTIQILQEIFPQKFPESKPGRHITANIQTLLLKELADRTCTELASALAKAGLTKHGTLLNDNGFSISFSLQADRQTTHYSLM